jgi:hypothetical protein
LQPAYGKPDNSFFGKILAVKAAMKSSLIWLLLGFFCPLLLLAQNDSVPPDQIDVKLLQQQQCMQSARHLERLTASHPLQSSDSLVAALVDYERQCGTGEASSRLNLLLLLAEGRLPEELLQDYYDRYLTKYYDRRTAALWGDPEEMYADHQGYFEFLPLLGNFDRFTQRWASALLDSQPNPSDGRLLCLLFSGAYGDFGEERSQFTYRNSFTSRYFKDKYGLVYGWEIEKEIRLGAWQPLGLSSNFYHPSPLLYFNVGIPLKNPWIIDVGGGLLFPQHKQLLQVAADSLTTAKTNVGLQFAASLRYRINQQAKWRLSAYSGIGYTNLFTNQTRSPREEYDEPRPYSVGALDLFAGLQCHRMWGERRALGVFVEVHHAAFGFDPVLLSQLSAAYLQWGLSYRFW